MTNQRPTRDDTEDRSEPEIIPPRRYDRRGDDGWPAPFFDERGGRRIYVAKIGPLGLVLVSLLAAVVAAATFVLLLGAVLIWIPVVGLLAAAAVIAGLLRAYFGRMR